MGSIEQIQSNFLNNRKSIHQVASEVASIQLWLANRWAKREFPSKDTYAMEQAIKAADRLKSEIERMIQK